jgi:hypothetical protein
MSSISIEKRSSVCPSLFSPTIDILLVGGLSLICLALCHLFIDSSSSITQISWTAFYLAYLVNHPHFLSSYLLLYWDCRKQLFKTKIILASVIVPLILIGYMFYCFQNNDPKKLGYLVNTMFFLVGWHYVKQIYGCIVVSCVRNLYFFSEKEKLILRINLYCVWFMSYINGNTYVRTLDFYGISYDTFNLPKYFQTMNMTILTISLILAIIAVIRKFIDTGKNPPAMAVVSLATIYFWYLPSMYHKHFFYIIPFFHSLQYLFLVVAYKKQKYSSDIITNNDKTQRILFVKNFWGFVILSLVTGFFFFDAIPNNLDQTIKYNGVFGTQLYLFAFIIFINIHHYFIDNVIWKKDNEKLKKHLFSIKTS